MYYLFVDDNREPEQVRWTKLPENVAWVKAHSYYEFVGVIGELGIPKFISYDCDLCDEHYAALFNLRERYLLHYKEFKTRCGIECVEYLLKLCKKKRVPHPPFIAHTKNQYAQGFIENLINKYNESLTDRY